MTEKRKDVDRAEIQPVKPCWRLGRRTLVKGALLLGAGSLSAAMLSVANSLKPTEAGKKLVAAGDRFVFAQRSGQEKVIVTEDKLSYKEAVLVFPEGKEDNEDNLIMLLRFRPEELEPPTILEWTAEGYVAYSAICTHLGCIVDFKTAKDDRDFPHLHSPCHAGIFDPRKGAIVISGPPPRPLPQLPIKINNQGEILADGWFEEPPGVL